MLGGGGGGGGGFSVIFPIKKKKAYLMRIAIEGPDLKCCQILMNFYRQIRL